MTIKASTFNASLLLVVALFLTACASGPQAMALPGKRYVVRAEATADSIHRP